MQNHEPLSKRTVTFRSWKFEQMNADANLMELKKKCQTDFAFVNTSAREASKWMIDVIKNTAPAKEEHVLDAIPFEDEASAALQSPLDSEQQDSVQERRPMYWSMDILQRMYQTWQVCTFVSK